MPSDTHPTEGITIMAARSSTQEREKTGRFAAGTESNRIVTVSNRDTVTAEPPEKISAGAQRLNEALRDVQDYLKITESQAVAITLYAAATHAIKTFPAFGRIFMSAKTPESGKTAAMLVCAYLSSNAVNTQGSSYAVTSRLAQAHNSPEQPTPTLYRDEISEVYGKSGLNSGAKDPISTVLREGYKRGATTSWSVNRVAEDINIYVPVIVAGNGTALPTDIRSRSIVIQMERGRPRLDLDSDGSEDRLRTDGRALGKEVKRHAAEMIGFTCETVVPGLLGRKHQIWRPLIAVALYVGGPAWYAKALRAFAELNGTSMETEVLSSDQQILKDLVSIVGELGMDTIDPDGERSFIPGKALTEELMNLERFEGRTSLSISQEIRRAMPVDISSTQRRVGTGNAVRGYYVDEILNAWEAVRPAASTEIAALEAEVDPFA
jgi:Protein of unknown function (DUF3631)